MVKYSFISPIGATAIFYDCPIGEMQKQGEVRDCYISLIKEIIAISDALGIKFENDLVEANLAVVDKMDPNSTVSLLRDVQMGHEAEIDGQIFNVVRMGKELSVPVPTYEKVAEKFGYKG
jgi:2-dehydropantoate 2-reductase